MSQPARDHQPRVEYRWYDVDGVRWHARASPRADDVPSRSVVVLLQGLVISGSFHEPMIGQLEHDFDVYAPDLPGFGRSEDPGGTLPIEEQADSLARWMQVAGLPPAAVLGTSYGAQLAAVLAARHPQRTVRVVLVSPTIDPAARPLPSLVLRWLRDSARERVRLMLYVAADYARAGLRRSLALLREMRAHRLEETLPAIRAPVLVVHGTRDPLVTRSWAEELARLAADGRAVVLPGAPHTINFSAPLELARVVCPFLAHDGCNTAAAAGSTAISRRREHMS